VNEKHGIEGGAIPASPSRKIIPAAEESAWRDGYRFLAEAKDRQAQEAARGYADGKAEGAKEAAMFLARTVADADRYLASLEPKLATLALDIVRQVLGEFDDAELVARAARIALSEFRDARSLTIKVHPASEDRLARMLAGMQEQADWPGTVIVIDADPEVAPQTCILATEFAVVDATIDAQLAAIAEAMQSQGGNQ
jgi:type III secretion protein L